MQWINLGLLRNWVNVFLTVDPPRDRLLNLGWYSWQQQLLTLRPPQPVLQSWQPGLGTAADWMYLSAGKLPEAGVRWDGPRVNNKKKNFPVRLFVALRLSVIRSQELPTTDFVLSIRAVIVLPRLESFAGASVKTKISDEGGTTVNASYWSTRQNRNVLLWFCS